MTPDLTVGKALDDYISEHIEADDSVVICNTRQRFARVYLNRAIGEMLVRDLDIPTCKAYIRRRRSGDVGTPAKPGTIRYEMGVLLAAINHAARWKRLLKNDIPIIERPSLPEPKTRWMSRDEWAALLKHADGRLRDYLLIAYYTAARKDAVLTLTWSQIDLERNRISLNPEGRVQTKKRRPIIPIAPELHSVLKRLLAAREGADEASEFVLGMGSIRSAFERAVISAGLKGVTPHTIRHTRATHLLQDGVSVWAVAGLLGDRVEMVTQVYAHQCPDHLAEAITAPRKKVLKASRKAVQQAEMQGAY